MSRSSGFMRSMRVLIIGLVVVLIVLGAALVVMVIGHAGTVVVPEQIDALANSTDACVTCHRKATPGIVEQFSHSTMAEAKVTCRKCHEVSADYPGEVEHEGSTILPSPTAARCEQCHTKEVAQYDQSRHSLPAWVAFAGSKDLSPDLMAKYQAVPEGSFSPNKDRNAIGAIEGPEITRFACESCHNIGKPAADNSIGQCQKCHLRHEFSLEQARKPETCNFCHIGPDHPQFEIYQVSPHGIAYATGGSTWNWEADPGSLTVKDFPAPTCAVCHMSGFGSTGTTHDVGDRLTWFLFAPVSERRPVWQDNKIRMQSVCQTCHNQDFIDGFYLAADQEVGRVNDWVKQSDAMMAPLNEKGLLTSAPFDEPIDYTYFELWHHWGRTAKFGTWMQGPDYSQWHGAYEVIKALANLQEMVNEKLQAAGVGK